MTIFCAVGTCASAAQSDWPLWMVKRWLPVISLRHMPCGDCMLESSMQYMGTFLYCSGRHLRSRGRPAPDLGVLRAGDALFQTHENLEHLAMMETVLGRIPESMAASASENARNYFMHRQVLSSGLLLVRH